MDFNTIFGAAVNGDAPFVSGDVPSMDLLSRSMVADAEEMARLRSTLHASMGFEIEAMNVPTTASPISPFAALTPEPSGYPAFTGFEDEADPEAALSSGAFGTTSTKPEFNVEDSLRALLGRV